MKSGGFRTDFRWNPADFRWNPVDFIWFHEIRQISGEIWQISYGFHTWNLPDFTHEIPRILKDQLPGMVSKCGRMLAWRAVVRRLPGFVSHCCLSSSASMRDVQKANLLHTCLHSTHPYWWKRQVQHLRITAHKLAGERTTLALKSMGEPYKVQKGAISGLTKWPLGQNKMWNDSHLNEYPGAWMKKVSTPFPQLEPSLPKCTYS